MVSKTYIISQAIYFMGVLPMGNEVGSRMNDILIDFVSGGMRPIERRRQLLSADLGGYGVLDMNVMNICMKSMWISRIIRKREYADYTGELILRDRDGSYERIGNNYMRGDNGVIIGEILSSWNVFYGLFVRIGRNIMEAEVFNNGSLTDNGRYLEQAIFSGNRIGQLENRLTGIKIKNLIMENMAVKEKAVIEQETGIVFTWVEYFRLRTVCQGIVGNNRGVTLPGISINEFMERGKLNCAKLRKIMEGKLSEKYLNNNPNTMASLVTLWGIDADVKGRIFVEWNLKSWTVPMLDPAFKDFCFKLLHGRLYLNSALSHFMEVQPWCTFCLLRKRKELNNRGILEDSPVYIIEVQRLDRETIKHCFLECDLVRNTVCKTINKITKTLNERICEKAYWEGGERNNKIETLISILTVRYIQFGIYRCRNRRTLPTVVSLYDDVVGLFEILWRKAKWRESLQSCHMFLREVLLERI
jgi:hypothetical protein